MKLVKVYKKPNLRYRNKLEQRLLESRQANDLFNQETRGESLRQNARTTREDYMNQRRRSSYNADDNDVEGSTNLVDCHWIARIYHLFSLSFLVQLVIKYIVAILLEHNAFRNYRYLDCYLIGRISFTGSMIPLSKYWFIWIVVQQIIWEFLMLFGKMKLKIDALEFLLSDLTSVLAWDNQSDTDERKTSLADKQKKSVQTDVISYDIDMMRRKSRAASNATYESYYRNSSYATTKVISQDGARVYTSISHFKAPYLHHGSDIFLLRPNRTAEAWINYQKYSYYYFLYVVINSIMWLAFSLVLSVLGNATRRGFELNYNLCIDWIADQQNKTPSNISHTSADYSHIYTPHQEYSLDDPVTSFIPFENLITHSLYHKVRIGLSMFESFFIFFTGCSQFFTQLYICMVISVDTVTHMRHCKTKLVEFTRSNYWTVASNNEMLSLNLSQAIKPVEDFSNSVTNEFHNRMSQIMELQASTYDLFNQIIRNNSYAAIFLPHVLLAWIYSGATSCFLQLTPSFNDQRGMLYECTTMWAHFSVFVLIVLVNFAKVESYSRSLYRNLASAMAFDNSIFTTKPNWIVLLDQYYPVPYYCYKVLGGTTVSYVFIIQVSCDLHV